MNDVTLDSLRKAFIFQRCYEKVMSYLPVVDGIYDPQEFADAMNDELSFYKEFIDDI